MGIMQVEQSWQGQKKVIYNLDPLTLHIAFKTAPVTQRLYVRPAGKS